MENAKSKTEALDRIYNKYTKARTELEDKVYKLAEENARYLRAQHWNESEVQQHELEGFRAYNIPLLATKINRVLAIQRTNRFDSKCYGREPEDELGAEAKNYLIKYVLDYNKFKYTESDMYRDGLTKKYGVICTEPSYEENPEGEIIMHREDWRCFYWDTNAKEYGLEDATFMGTVKWLPLDEVKMQFPDFEMDNAEMAHSYQDTYGTLADWCDPKKQLIKVITHFEREIETVYLCKNLQTGDFDRYDTKQQAQEAIQQKIEQTLTSLAEQEEIELSITESDFEVIPRRIKKWKKIVFSGKNLISEEDWAYSRPPYFRYACFEDDGEIWSLADLAKDPQKLFDRLSTMADKSTAKNIKGNNYEVVYPHLHPMHQGDLDGLMRGLASGGQVVAVTRQGAFNAIDNRNNIQIEVGLMDKYQTYIEDILGGRTFQGLETKGEQTATEVSVTENNAKQTTSLFLDNLARWKLSLTEYLIELIDDVFSKNRKVRVMGEVRSQELLQMMKDAGVYTDARIGKGEYGWVDTGKLPKPLSQYRVDIQIDDVTATTLDRQSKFLQLLELNNIAVRIYGQPLPFEFILQYANVDPTIKAGLVKFQQQAEMQRQKQVAMAEAQAKIQGLSNLANTFKPEPPKQQQGTPTAQSMEQQYQSGGIE